MNTRIFLIAVAFTTGLFFTSCEKDDGVAKPVITIHEIGNGESHGSDHTAITDGEIHMDIDIVAEGKISTIHLRIHPVQEHYDISSHEEWELDSIYTKFSGLRNTTFHEHVAIDTSAETGKYHFDFIVTDMAGNQSSAEDELQIVEN